MKQDVSAEILATNHESHRVRIRVNGVEAEIDVPRALTSEEFVASVRAHIPSLLTLPRERIVHFEVEAPSPLYNVRFDGGVLECSCPPDVARVLVVTNRRTLVLIPRRELASVCFCVGGEVPLTLVPMSKDGVEGVEASVRPPERRIVLDHARRPESAPGME